MTGVVPLDPDALKQRREVLIGSFVHCIRHRVRRSVLRFLDCRKSQVENLDDAVTLDREFRSLGRASDV